MMGKILLMSMLLLSFGSVSAQTMDAIKSRLGQADITGGQVTITEEPGVASALARAQSETPERFDGFRVVVFMGNSGTARGEAVAARDRFLYIFPGIRCVLSYENPYFKVTVGSCVSEEAAVILLQRVKGEFPKSFITREKISPSEFSAAEEVIPVPQLTEEGTVPSTETSSPSI